MHPAHLVAAVIKTVFVSLLLHSVAAQATPSNARLYKQQYGYMPSCNACHSEGGGSALNNFGKTYRDAGKNLAAFVKIAKADSDGDGVANSTEAEGKSNPGDKKSVPGKAGTWLDLSGLIPKEVQSLFPGVLSWVPKDAVLTAADIATAKTMGATLSAADENTIYIPVENQRPAGTALIFPVAFQGKTFYLVMATDASKELKITKLQVMNAKDVPAAKTSGAYARLVGLSAPTVPVAKGEAIDDVIANTVRNAGVLLILRLKGA